ncbi:MAG TPA: hypothetical protein PLE45_12715 [Spirochaetota bacterium]|nr:hypothetical protein [Spirochaetota bacterium]HOL58152.1 hypothetical protein [Spirochaetota bacterium]HPP05618.1 hypothetical protein [Spirochaetota bacterium]
MNRYFYLIIFLLLSSISIFSQKIKREPSWVYLKKAENLKIKGEYALAIIEARKARNAFIEEKIEKFYIETRKANPDKTEYEIKKIVEQKKESLMTDDNYPQYHELIGDLYTLTGLLNEAEDEYKKALNGAKYFDYPQKGIELRYKLANVYTKKGDYELADIVYREIVTDYFKLKEEDFWNRVRYNIKNDKTLSHVFRIYRIDGIEYLMALYRIGVRSALLNRKEDAIFFLANAAIVWMTYYSSLIKKYEEDFQYAGPADFIPFLNNKNKYEYITDDYIMDEIMFFIGYVYGVDKNYKIRDSYFNLSLAFSKGTNREVEIFNRIEYFKKDPEHILGYEEFIY